MAMEKTGAIGSVQIPNPRAMDIPWARSTLARFADLDVIRRSRLKKCVLFEMEDSPELDIVRAEYMALAEQLWAGVEPLTAIPLKDREIFDLLGFE